MRALIPLLIAFGLAIAAPVVWGDEITPDGREPDAQGELERLRGEINVANLINGLHLGDEQTRQLLALAREAQQIRQSGRELLEAHRGEMESAYAELHTDVVAGNGIRPEINRRAGRIHGQEVETRRRMEREVCALEQQAEALLTEGQRETLLRFNPCLLPPQWLNEPPRAGQGGSNHRAAQNLERLRQVPDHIFARRESEIVDRHLNALREHGHVNLTDQEQRAEAQRVSALMRRVRAMSDLDFSLQQEALADELMTLANAQDEWEVEQRRRFTPPDRPGRTARFLFSRPAIAVLEARVAQLDDHQGTEGAGLAEVAPADNCDDGQCALPSAGGR